MQEDPSILYNVEAGSGPVTRTGKSLLAAVFKLVDRYLHLGRVVHLLPQRLGGPWGEVARSDQCQRELNCLRPMLPQCIPTLTLTMAWKYYRSGWNFWKNKGVLAKVIQSSSSSSWQGLLWKITISSLEIRRGSNLPARPWARLWRAYMQPYTTPGNR